MVLQSLIKVLFLFLKMRGHPGTAVDDHLFIQLCMLFRVEVNFVVERCMFTLSHREGPVR